MPTITLTRDVDARIREEGRRAYPHECCGVLVGRLDGDDKAVTEIYPQVNERDDSPENRFLISPDHIRDSELKAMQAGLDVLGYYHSHPDHPARPSEFDREHAWPWYSYIIVAVAKGRDEAMTSWQLVDDRSHMVEETLTVPGSDAASTPSS